MAEPRDKWGFTVKAATACTVLALPIKVFQEVIDQSEALRAHVERFKATLSRPQNDQGEALIELAAGLRGSRRCRGPSPITRPSPANIS